MSTDAFLDTYFIDVDETLDQLIENAEMLETIQECKEEFATEFESLEVLQESLLNRLVNLDNLMEIDNVKPHSQKDLVAKMKRYSELEPSILPTLGKRFKIDHDQLKISRSRKQIPCD